MNPASKDRSRETSRSARRWIAGFAVVALLVVATVLNQRGSFLGSRSTGRAVEEVTTDAGARIEVGAAPAPPTAAREAAGAGAVSSEPRAVPITGRIADCNQMELATLSVLALGEGNAGLSEVDAAGAFQIKGASGVCRLEVQDVEGHVLAARNVENPASGTGADVGTWEITSRFDASVQIVDRTNRAWRPERHLAWIGLWSEPTVVALLRAPPLAGRGLVVAAVEELPGFGRDDSCWRSQCGVFSAEPAPAALESGVVTAGRIRVTSCLPVEAVLLCGTEILARTTIRARTDLVSFTLDEAELARAFGSVRGRILVPDGARYRGGVQVLADPRIRAYVLQDYEAGGNFRVERLRPGPCWFVAVVHGYARSLRAIEIRAGEEIDLGDIEIVDGHTLQGVLQAVDGTPVSSAGLWIGTLARQGEDRWIGSFPDVFDPTTGAFYVPHLPSERVLVGVDDSRFALNPVVVDMADGDVTDLVLTAQPGFALQLQSPENDLVARLRVLDANGWVLYTAQGIPSNGCKLRLAPGSYRIEGQLVTGEARAAPFQVFPTEATRVIRF